MDASSSAYQIMSYFLFNKELAVCTNWVKDFSAKKDEIKDLYNFLLLLLKVQLDSLLEDKRLADVGRKLV